MAFSWTCANSGDYVQKPNLNVIDRNVCVLLLFSNGKYTFFLFLMQCSRITLNIRSYSTPAQLNYYIMNGFECNILLSCIKFHLSSYCFRHSQLKFDLFDPISIGFYCQLRKIGVWVERKARFRDAIGLYWAFNQFPGRICQLAILTRWKEEKKENWAKIKSIANLM